MTFLQLFDEIHAFFWWPIDEFKDLFFAIDRWDFKFYSIIVWQNSRFFHDCLTKLVFFPMIVWWNSRFHNHIMKFTIFSQSFDKIHAFFGDWLMKLKNFIFFHGQLIEIRNFFCCQLTKFMFFSATNWRNILFSSAIFFPWQIDRIHNFICNWLIKLVFFSSDTWDSRFITKAMDKIHTFISWEIGEIRGWIWQAIDKIWRSFDGSFPKIW